jgi:hypothetical protein
LRDARAGREHQLEDLAVDDAVVFVGEADVVEQPLRLQWQLSPMNSPPIEAEAHVGAWLEDECDGLLVEDAAWVLDPDMPAGKVDLCSNRARLLRHYHMTPFGRVLGRLTATAPPLRSA